MSDIVELEGGFKRCKKYQKRSKATGHCRNRSGSRRPWNLAGRLTKMRRLSNGDLRKEYLSYKVRGGEVIEGGGEVVQLVEGGAKKPCKKYQKRSKSTGRCKNVLARMSPTMRKSKSKSRSRKMRGGEVIEGGEVEVVQLVEGGAKKPCKKYQKRSKSTGHCKNVLARMSPKMRKSKSKSRSRKMRGGEVIEGGEVEVVQVVEGGAKKPCKKYQKRSKSTGRCKNVLARMSPTMRKSKSKSRSRKMRGGEVIEGGEVVEVVEGGAKCKRGKTRRGTGVCHKPKSRSRSRSRSRRM